MSLLQIQIPLSQTKLLGSGQQPQSLEELLDQVVLGVLQEKRASITSCQDSSSQDNPQQQSPRQLATKNPTSCYAGAT